MPSSRRSRRRSRHQGRSLADVATVTAYFGPDQSGVIQGFGIPEGDAADVQDALVDVYLIGIGEMERTERDVGDHSVTFLSEGPLETAEHPFAVLPDAGVLWILNAEMTQHPRCAGGPSGGRRGHGTGQHGTAPTPGPRSDRRPGTARWARP